MTKKEALELLFRLKVRYDASKNTTLEAIINNPKLLLKDDEALCELRELSANITWDTSLDEAREIVLEESE